MGEPVAPAGDVSSRMDAIRGLAAFLVVLGHAREKMMYIQDVKFPSWMNLALAPTGYAQEAVSVFFVLSGYLVGGSVLRDTRAGRFDWYTYLCKRASRLWVVLLPGLLLTAGLDAIARGIHTERFVIAVEGSNNDLSTALCNALFLSPGWCKPYGTNASLWSLAYEFWFYIGFAAIASTLIPTLGGPTRWVLALLLVSAGLVALGPTFLSYSISWLMGVVVYRVSQGRRYRKTPLIGYLVIFVLLVGTMTATSLWHIDRGLQMVAVGSVTALLLFVIVRDTDEGRNSCWVIRSLGRIGPWSYSLYVYHLPVLTAILIVMPGSLIGDSPLIACALVYTVSIAASLLSWLLSLVTERHTGRVRSALLGVRAKFRRNDQRLRVTRT